MRQQKCPEWLFKFKYLDFLCIFIKCCKAEEFAEKFCYENGERNGLLLLEVFCQVVIGKTSLVKIDPWEEDQPFQTTRLPAPRPCGIARVAPLHWVKLWSSGNRLLVQHWRCLKFNIRKLSNCGLVTKCMWNIAKYNKSRYLPRAKTPHWLLPLGDFTDSILSPTLLWQCLTRRYGFGKALSTHLICKTLKCFHVYRSFARVLSTSVSRQWLGADRRQGRSQRRGKQELWMLITGSTEESW